MQEKKCVLVCDDDISILDACRLVLSRDYHVETATTCENIIEEIRRINPGIILMDLMIPGGGEKAVNVIHQTEEIKEIPIILFSAVHNIKEINKRIKATAILEKPFDINTLLETIENNIL